MGALVVALVLTVGSNDSGRFADAYPRYRSTGLLVDLGYVSHRMIQDGQEHGVVFALRLK